MGCVASQKSNLSPRSDPKPSFIRDSSNPQTNDIELARKRDQQRDVGLLTKKVQQVQKVNQELTRELTSARREFEVKKKQSNDSLEEKTMQMKKLEEEKNREIERLKKELERERVRSLEKVKQKSTDVGNLGKEIKQSKENQMVGLSSLAKHSALCEECFYKLPRHVATSNKMMQCFSCKGYGVILERFPFGANPSCDKSLCFSKGWDKVKALKLCQICQGRGGKDLSFRMPLYRP